MSDVNQKPRQWADESGRVIEGWHPSDPGRIGYNLMVDDDWFGTFGTLDDASTAAAACADLDDGRVVLRPYPPGPDRRSIGARLYLVQPASDETDPGPDAPAPER